MSDGYIAIRKETLVKLRQRLRWALSGRVVATAVTTADGIGYLRVGDWLSVNGELRRVHIIDGPQRWVYLY